MFDRGLVKDQGYVMKTDEENFRRKTFANFCKTFGETKLSMGKIFDKNFFRTDFFLGFLRRQFLTTNFGVELNRTARSGPFKVYAFLSPELYVRSMLNGPLTPRTPKFALLQSMLKLFERE